MISDESQRALTVRPQVGALPSGAGLMLETGEESHNKKCDVREINLAEVYGVS